MFDSYCMKRLNKILLNKQMDVYLQWGIRNHVASSGYRFWLDLFCKKTHRTDVLDITEEDIDLFFQMVDNVENARYRKNEARKAILGFTRYYMARTKNGKTRIGRGRPQRTEQVERVKMMREMDEPMTFREIARALKADVGQVYKWFTYAKRDMK